MVFVQVNEGSVAAGAAGTSPGEQLSRRCVQLLKAALKPDVWPHLCEPKLMWLDKVLETTILHPPTKLLCYPLHFYIK